MATQLVSVSAGAAGSELILFGNDGTASLDVNTLTVAIAPFIRTMDGRCGNSLPFTMAQNSGCTITDRFAPTALGAASRMFRIGESAPGATRFPLPGALFFVTEVTGLGCA